jgi:uncharacterized protein YqjF (DUF2071 family)
VREIEHQRETLSDLARKRLLSLPREPLFLAEWDRALMIHYEVDPAALQRTVPFPLDLREGRAFVSTVAFTMRRMRLRWGGTLTEVFSKPLRTQEFLNFRTYVKCRDETGIYFLAEWLSDRLSVALGPKLFGLPYRFGQLRYHHRAEDSRISGIVRDGSGHGSFAYQATLDVCEPRCCEPGSLEEWLMERYTAFTYICGKSRFFRVWHPPWLESRVSATVTDRSLLEANWKVFKTARVVGGNFSDGVAAWMGWPHRLCARVSP